jgi:WD40 repeat protein
MSYDIRQLRGPQSVNDVGRECIALHHLFGADNTRRSNLGIIDEDKVIYITSNSLVIENIATISKEYINGIDGMGIGCYAIHPSKKYIAVGNKGYQPKIYIYNYPDMTIYKVLNGGAERGYASLSFNAEGDKLASVATAPDYILTIWEWEEEKLGLHTKAFGQDVFNVKFSLDDDRRLTTSGTGHIRFWKMAATFTGLKLQGYIGKFGKVELSDISAYTEPSLLE